MSGFPDDTDIEAKASVSQEWIHIASTQGGVTPAVWRKWWKDCTAFQELMEIALRSTDLFRRLLQQGGRTTVLRGIAESNLCSPLIPETDVSYFSGTKSNTGGQALLTPSLAWALVRELPDTSRHAWECIYSSKRDGRSWSTFQNAVEQRGSILLLVREKQPSSSASLVGTYIDMELFRKPTWHGTSDNMLFAIGPNEPERLAVFRATGFNNHYQYFNYATKTLPNGIGVGGQMGHFGLWIDSSFTRGSSSTAATFESRQLSHSSEFDVDVVEAWLVRPAKRDDDGDSQPKASAVDANPEAVALLEMANRTMYSKMMVREPDTSA
ncbi:hypothetical protein EV175_001948 [Coemansia sp. RSA 1933]|nr:hypothetical protein EV175_001948 [Coemansia sp. RSA 1933]